ncbi:hypothetical protein TrVGV298_004082 [Trichoderma virens]|nr:hypothetical protein TrVGV298_004082 [Trichoderma virens]
MDEQLDTGVLIDYSPKKTHGKPKQKQQTERRKSTSQSERTHDENTERAYIAASRRGDRDIEARIKSALQASKIHKKRTGKALRITREIVLNEAMYEEEDTELERFREWSLRLPTGSLQGGQGKEAFEQYFPNYKQAAAQPIGSQWYQRQAPLQPLPQQTSPIQSPEMLQISGMQVQIPLSGMSTHGMQQTPWMGQSPEMQMQSPVGMGMISPAQVQSPMMQMGQVPDLRHASPTQQDFDLCSQFVDSGINTPSAEILSGLREFTRLTPEDDRLSSESSTPPELSNLNHAQMPTPLSTCSTCTCNPAQKYTCDNCRPFVWFA